MIKIIELSSGMFKGPIAEQIQQAIKDNHITRENLIDIKYDHDGAVSYALIIYEDGRMD